jgi:mannose-6-phosphate isomerase-like protein (cupin superfamily)
MRKLSIACALAGLSETGEDFARLLEQRAFDVGMDKPLGVDPQHPHARDELYLIATDWGSFLCAGETEACALGDVFFVPAGVDHRFVDFSPDYATLVIFLGER